MRNPYNARIGNTGKLWARRVGREFLGLACLIALLAQGCVVSPLDQSELDNIYDDFDVLGYTSGPNQTVTLQLWHFHIDHWAAGPLQTKSASTPSDPEGKLYPYEFRNVHFTGPTITIDYDHGRAQGKLRVLYGKNQAVTFDQSGMDCAVNAIMQGVPISQAGGQCYTGNTVRITSRDWQPKD